MLKIFFFILCLIQHQTSACAASQVEKVTPSSCTLIPCAYRSCYLQCSYATAAKEEHWNCIIALEEQRVSYNECDEFGDTILHGIASFGYYTNHANVEFQRLYQDNVPRILRRPHINLNAQNDCGDTPLHVAITHWNIYFCEQLLNNKAIRCDIKNNLGETARDLIQKNIDFLRVRFISSTGSPYQRLYNIIPNTDGEKQCTKGPLVDLRFCNIPAWENLLKRVSIRP